MVSGTIVASVKGAIAVNSQIIESVDNEVFWLLPPAALICSAIRLKRERESIHRARRETSGHPEYFIRHIRWHANAQRSAKMCAVSITMTDSCLSDIRRKASVR